MLSAQYSTGLVREAVKYLPPFDLIRQSLEIVPVKGELRVSASYEDFLKIIKLFLEGVEIDQVFYRGQYEDIAEAEREGRISSLRRHFVENGYFEGRLPFAPAVDEAWYRRNNPDVDESIRQGLIGSAQEHFVSNGYREGRMPAGK
jgi:hypothetical protein